MISARYVAFITTVWLSLPLQSLALDSGNLSYSDASTTGGQSGVNGAITTSPLSSPLVFNFTITTPPPGIVFALTAHVEVSQSALDLPAGPSSSSATFPPTSSTSLANGGSSQSNGGYQPEYLTISPSTTAGTTEEPSQTTLSLPTTLPSALPSSSAIAAQQYPGLVIADQPISRGQGADSAYFIGTQPLLSGSAITVSSGTSAVVVTLTTDNQGDTVILASDNAFILVPAATTTTGNPPMVTGSAAPASSSGQGQDQGEGAVVVAGRTYTIPAETAQVMASSIASTAASGMTSQGSQTGGSGGSASATASTRQSGTQTTAGTRTAGAEGTQATASSVSTSGGVASTRSVSRVLVLVALSGLVLCMS